MKKYSVKDYQISIGERVKQYRINLGMTQQELEIKSGVSVRSISRLEQGASVQLDSLIKVLIALNLADNLDLLIPDQTKRPSYYLNHNEKTKQRVRKKENKQNKFQWGDEE